MTALPINLCFGAVCGAVLCAFTPVDGRPGAAPRFGASSAAAAAAASSSSSGAAGSPSAAAVRRQALRVLAAFAVLALAPAAAYLQAIFPDWSVLYLVPARALLDSAAKRALAPLLAAIAVVLCAFLGWLAAEAAAALVLSRRRARATRPASDSGDDSGVSTDGGLLARFAGLAQPLAQLLADRLLGTARAVRWLTAFGLAAVGGLLALLARGRLGLVGSYQQFHADRWLMQPLLSSASKLPFALVVINLGIGVSLALAAQLLRWRSDLLALPQLHHPPPRLPPEPAELSPISPNSSA